MPAVHLRADERKFYSVATSLLQEWIEEEDPVPGRGLNQKGLDPDPLRS